MRCPHCAEYLDDDLAVCTYCGETVSVARRPRHTRRAARHQREDDLLEAQTVAAGQGGIAPIPVRRSPREEQQDLRNAYRNEIATQFGESTEPIKVRKPKRKDTVTTLSGKRISLAKRTTNWAIIAGLVLVFLVAVGITAYMLLTRTDMGLIQLAAWGYEVDVETQWKLGELRMREGYIGQALEIFQKAHEEQPEYVEGAMLLGTALERDGQIEEAQALYLELIEEFPEYPEAYSKMISFYRDAGDHQAAIALMEKGFDTTEMVEFSDMLSDYMPDTPFANPIGGRSTEDITVTLQAVDDIPIYYTLDGTDPLEVGEIYTEPLFMSQGTYELHAVAVQQNGIPSKVLEETYTIQYPKPAAPQANVASGTYEKSRKVTLRPGGDDNKAKKDVVAIHYTTDGTPATIDSPLFTDPIQLPLGTSELRAIAVDKRGETSFEMIVGYKVKGNVKKAFNENDKLGKFSLMQTTYEQFTKTHGEPSSYTAFTSDKGEQCHKAAYSFGHACFVELEGKQVLYEVEIVSDALSGPRKVKVGMEMIDAMALFRDLARSGNAEGERLLYDDGEDKLGILRLEEDGNLAAHYYYPRAANDYAELSLYFNAREVLERIVWLRYTGDTE